LKVRIVSRDSFLALAQTLHTAEILDHAQIPWEIIALKTLGDINLQDPLYNMKSGVDKEGKAFFTKELESALLESSGDIAVHSLKDLPTELPHGLMLHSVFSPEVSGDMVVTRTSVEPASLAGWLNGATIGSSSLRRAAQLKQYAPGVELVNVRGNLITRFEKLLASDSFHGLLLASAGIRRLFAFFQNWPAQKEKFGERLASALRERLDADHARLSVIIEKNLHFYDISPDVILPAVSQGVLGLETRIDYPLSALRENQVLREKTNMEREIMSSLGAGCSVPLGLYSLPLAEQTLETVTMENATVGNLFRTQAFYSPSFSVTDAVGKEFRATRFLTPERSLWLSSEMRGEDNSPLLFTGKSMLSFKRAIEETGCSRSVHYIPFIKTEFLSVAMPAIKLGTVIVATSPEAVQYLLSQAPDSEIPVFAAGDSSARRLRAYFQNVTTPHGAGALAAARAVLAQKIKDVLWITAENGIAEGYEFLRAQGVRVQTLFPYKNVPLESVSIPQDQDYLWIFSSPSAASHYASHFRNPMHKIAAMGETTALSLLANGIQPYIISSGKSFGQLIKSIQGREDLRPFSAIQWRIP